MSLGGWEVAVIGLVVLLLWGSRLPSVMRSLGLSVNEFKRGLNDESKAIEEQTPEEAPKK